MAGDALSAGTFVTCAAIDTYQQAAQVHLASALDLMVETTLASRAARGPGRNLPRRLQ